MENAGPIGPGAGLPDVVAKLERLIAYLAQGPALRMARERLEAAIETSDPAEISEAAQALREELDVIAWLTKAVETIDPHVLDPAEFKKVWRKWPRVLVKEALVEGKLRERRIILQAKEARTNQLLALAAFAAALAAVAGPFIERWLSG
jgi:hypothetical protein